MAEQFIDITAGAGWSTVPPPRAMDPRQPGPVWRRAENARFQDSVARMRPALSETPATDFFSLITKNGTGNEQYPVWMWSGVIGREATTRVGIPVQQHAMIVVTTRDVWLNYNGSWSCVTPTYSTGTVTATNGSPTVTGAGTAWLARFICPTSRMRIDGSDYIISTVDAAGQVTLTSNFTGVTAAGKAYTITRNFGGLNLGSLSNASYTVCSLFNGDLYIAGTTTIGMPAVNAGPTECGGPGVLRLAGMFDSGGPTATYLMARHAVVAGVTEFDGTAGTSDRLLDIRGMQLMQDGRVILATHEMPRAAYAGGRTSFVGNRIRYSSHLDQTVWTSAPGGFFDVVGYSDKSLTAIGALGGVFTAHFEDAIVSLRPSGQDDPPLQVNPTTSRVGALHQRVLANTHTGDEIFIDRSGGIYTFDGQSASKANMAAEFDLRPSIYKTADYFAYYDPYDQAYNLFARSTNTASPQTAWWNFLLSSGRASYSAIGTCLTAAAPLHGLIGTTTTNQTNREPSAMAGMPSYNNTSSVANTAVLATLRQDVSADTFTQLTASPASTNAVVLQSDYLSPGGDGVDHNFTCVAIWVNEPFYGLGGGVTTAALAVSLLTSPTGAAISLGSQSPHLDIGGGRVAFFGCNVTAEAIAVQITCGSIDVGKQVTAPGEIFKVRVYYNVVGDTRTVARDVP